MPNHLKTGDPVIFVVSKSSTIPGPRAKSVHPSPAGESYTYQVEKFWTVAEVCPDGHAILVTRRGKRHDVQLDDPRLRPAHWWERWIYRERFPVLNASSELAEARSR